MLALAMVAGLFALPSPPPALAASCTGWTNKVLPPPSIRVYRTAKGVVETVNFRTYVQEVMAPEWPSWWPVEALKAGAVAVKQYGWYFTMHYRGGVAGGRCYDVVDTWADQVYNPEKYTPTSSQLAAVTATWPVSLRKYGSFFMTGYHAGSKVTCGSNSNGYRLYQWSAYDCAVRGAAYEWILRRYYYPGLQVVRPGAHQVTGSYPGDGTAIVPGTAAGRIRPRVYTSTGRSFAASPSPDFALPGTVIGRVSADVTGDGREDLVLLVADGTNDQSLWVLRGTSGGYSPPARWWYARDEMSNAAIRLVATDFTGDGRADAGLIVGYGDFSRSVFYMVRSVGYGFTSKSLWWSGTLDARRTAAYGGDATGDGRGDVVLEIDRGTAGLAYRVLRSVHGGGRVVSTSAWLDATSLRRTTTATVLTDHDGDGRDDLVVSHPYGTGTRLTALHSLGYAFSGARMWTSSTLPWSSLKLSRADANGDGAGDVVGFIKRTTGTRIVVFRSYGSGMTAAVWLDDSTLNWAAARPY